MDEAIQVIYWKSPEPDSIASSLFVGGVHLIFISIDATPEEQMQAEKRERARKMPK